MIIKFPLASVSKTLKSRSCNVCDNGRKSDWLITFKAGYNKTFSIAYCEEHFQQVKNDIKEL